MFSSEVLELLENFRVARVLLPNADGSETALECVVRTTAPSSLEARFLPEQLPAGLQEGTPCRLVCEVGLSVLSIQARIEAIDNPFIHLRIEGGSSHGDPRHHFRVDAQVALKFWGDGEHEPTGGCPMEVNLSSGGIRFQTEDSLELGELLNVSMQLPGAVAKTVRCVGRVVGVWRKDGQGQEVVLKFIRIAPDHLDRLTEFCLGVKFRQMCNRAEFLGSIFKPRQNESDSEEVE